jgi:hypothetical protein
MFAAVFPALRSLKNSLIALCTSESSGALCTYFQCVPDFCGPQPETDNQRLRTWEQKTKAVIAPGKSRFPPIGSAERLCSFLVSILAACLLIGFKTRDE